MVGDPQSFARDLLKNSESTSYHHQCQFRLYYITGMISIFDIINNLCIIYYRLESKILSSLSGYDHRKYKGKGSIKRFCRHIQSNI